LNLHTIFTFEGDNLNFNIKGARNSPKMEYTCMNCRKILENPEGPFGKRFCSEECRREYMGK
jgi:DNA-directed RNA polymerase subunit RPC12/RpoP